MRTIGVRELKAHLSRVLRDVQDGETILVTDRGRVVAEMRRPDGVPVQESRVDRARAHLASIGELRVAERSREPYQSSPIVLPDGSARALLDAGRDEGRGDA